MHELPGSATPHLDVSVRRPLGRAGDAARAHADGGGRGPPRRPAGRRARLGQEPAGARVRARGGRGRRARALRRLRRGRAHAVRAVRRGARSPHARHRPRRAAGSRWAPRAASSRGCSPTCRRASATCRSRSRPIRTPSAIGCTRRSPTCSSALSRPAGAARARGRALGRRLDAPAPAPPGPRRRPRARAAARHLPRHRGRPPGHALARRSPTCAAPTTSSGCGSPASPTRRSASSSATPRAATLGAGPPELAQAICELTGGQPLPRLRAVARAWSRPASWRSSTAAIRPTRPLAELGTPESVREVVSQRLSRLAPAPPTSWSSPPPPDRSSALDVVRGPPASTSPTCSPRSTRPSAAA